MLVVALLAVSASIAVPRALDARNTANELAAIRSLLTIARAQQKCQAIRAIDVNNDGIGEFGFFGELLGKVNVRGGTARIRPPVLSSAFGSVTQSMVLNSGFLFQMYLPDVACMGVTEAYNGGDPSNSQGVDPIMAEKFWCCYAWPASWGVTGISAFFVNQSGKILATKNLTSYFPYNGSMSTPSVVAAFINGSSGTLECHTAADTIGMDGNRWTPIN